MNQEDQATKPTTSGLDRRELLFGGAAAATLVAAGTASAKPDRVPTKPGKELWGPRVDLTGLEDLYGPREVPGRTVVPGGIDHLGLHSTDVFEIDRFGAGIFEVNFNGYFRVARAHATTQDWTTFSLRVNIIDLKLRGSHPELGEITVRLNPDIVSTGQIFPAKTADGDAECRIATAVTFEIPKMGVTLRNREPILLMNNHVRSIPPVDDPSGQALLYKLPLFDVIDPKAPAVAYLTSLKYGADHYLTRPQFKAIQES
jgi:hypothetical protein